MINIAPKIVNCDSILILATFKPALKITTIQKATKVPKIFPLPPKIYVPPNITIKTISSSAPVAILNLATANRDVVKTPATPLIKPDNVNNNNLGFRLPTESEWYVAAAVLYNWEDGSTTNFDYTVQVGSGVINCNYGNILNCGGEAKDVGSYSDLSDCLIVILGQRRLPRDLVLI